MKLPQCLLVYVLLFLAFSGCSGNQKNKGDGEMMGEVPDAWYRNAFVYNIEVGTFKDSDGDGTGDFKGLSSKLGYLDSLGVDVIWLSPFQPSPGRDDGYDVSDYFGINKKYGSEKDFQDFMREARKRRMRVIMDVVLNHTSNEHSWYRAARADSTSKYYQWYVWSAERPGDWDKGMVFPGIQNETWSYDNIASKYYFHRFYAFQPDLNYRHPEVREQASKILLYWLDKGVDGFRLDAVPFIIDIPETGSDDPDHMFEILSELRKTVQSVKKDALLLGEANVTAKENAAYFGPGGNRLQMMFNFFANQHLFYSFAARDPQPFVNALEDFREKPPAGQWAFFLRNHDEIDLERLSSRQRNKVYDEFGPETNMQLYERGIRRRLAPMLDDSRRLAMAYSLLFSLPGTPVIRYGEEIGMGDDLMLNERLSVRTPMQWNSGSNAGFSNGPETFRPVITGGKFDYRKVNVQAELLDSASLLNLIRKLVAIRREHPEIGRGNWNAESQAQLLVMRYELNGRLLVALHNFGAEAVRYRYDGDIDKNAHRLLASVGVRSVGAGLVVPAYGFAWYTFDNVSDSK